MNNLTELREKYKDVKVVLGIPSSELIHTRFFNSLINLLMHLAPMMQVYVANCVGSRITKNRNLIVKISKQFKATHILWLDADGVFPVDTLEKLLEHDKDVVGAATCLRDGKNFYPLCEAVNKEDIHKDLFSVKMLGMQALLTRTEVFDKLKKPYFSEPPAWTMGVPAPYDEEAVGEDIYFTSTLLDAGFEIFCDMKLSKEIGHIGSSANYITAEGFKTWSEAYK